MILRYTEYARAKMSREGIAEWAIMAVITNPEWSQIGETASEYRSRVAGFPLPLHAVLVAGRDPALVITVYWVDR